VEPEHPNHGSPSLPLAGLSVVECGEGVSAALAAKLLAMLGARVIKVEPPEGDVTRRRGPFAHDVQDPEKSGLFLFLNADKRGVTLDLKQPRERRMLDDLLAAADILIHNVPPAARAACGLEGGALCRSFPGLIVTAISAFGGSGPRANYHAYELNAVHASGLASLTPRFSPFPELPPLKFCGHQAELQGGVHAAIATLGAYQYRLGTGAGQAIDVSEQECIAPMLSLSFLPYEGLHITRLGGRANVVPWGIYECSDGEILFTCGDDGQWQRLVDLMGDPDWGHEEIFKDREARFENQDALNALLNEWTKTQRVEELWRESQRRRIPAAPVKTMGEMYADEQLRARGFFVPMPGLERDGAPVLVPGIPIKSAAMAWRFHNRAPRLGEHNRQILADPAAVARPPIANAQARDPASAGPLAGVRVLDFSWVWSGPYCGLQFAHLGAEVIRVESALRPCLNRCIHPYAEGRIGLNRAAHYHQWNQSKQSVQLDLSKPEGVQVARELVRHCDVVIENFTPGVMDRLGLGWAALSAVKPGLVMISLSGYGQTGPFNRNLAYGGLIGGQSGLYSVNGYPGDKTREVGITYADPTTGVWGAYFAIAGLAHKTLTGQGQHIDLSMYEVMEMMLAEPLMEYAINGRETQPPGNRDRWMSPHNCYKARGDAEQWVAIAVGTEHEWRALCEVIGQPSLAEDPRFKTVAMRKQNEDELDRIISAWTAARDRWEITEMMQRAGVAAIPTFLDWDLFDDPHLRERGYFVELEHAEVGKRPIAGVPYSMSLTPCKVRKAAPCLGADTDEVLTRLLGYSPDKIAHLRKAGILA
jgi:crotonobetainyl-CoA:carnitine CoA-transferase CaiB-like acyl-CoA transferase